MKKHLASLLVVIALFALPARAMDIGLLGVLNLSGAEGTHRTAAIATPPFAGASSFGFGVLFRGSANPLVNLELGALFIPRKWDVGANATLSTPTLEIPLLLRFTAIPIVSFGVGGYYALKVGDTTQTGTGAFGVYNGTNLKTHDYGLVAAVGVEIPFAPKVGFLLEGRFLWGLADLDPDLVGTLRVRSWQLVGGLKVKL